MISRARELSTKMHMTKVRGETFGGYKSSFFSYLCSNHNILKDGQKSLAESGIRMLKNDVQLKTITNNYLVTISFLSLMAISRTLFCESKNTIASVIPSSVVGYVFLTLLQVIDKVSEVSSISQEQTISAVS